MSCTSLSSPRPISPSSPPPTLFPLQGRRSQRSVPSASRRSTLAREAGRLTPGQVFQASRRSRASLRPLSSRLPCPGPGPAGAQSLDRVHTRRRAFVKRGRYDLTIRKEGSLLDCSVARSSLGVSSLLTGEGSACACSLSMPSWLRRRCRPTNSVVNDECPRRSALRVNWAASSPPPAAHTLRQPEPSPRRAQSQPPR
jgi:hypothetical protein